MIKIDFNVNKHDLYLFVLMIFFILITYIYANFVVMPNLDEYIDLKSKYNFQKNIQKYLKETSQDAKVEYAGLKSYLPFFNHMQNFDKSVLESFLKKYFQNVDLTFLQSSSDGRVKMQLYRVHVWMPDTKNFFQFLHDIKKGYPIGVEEPVEMKKSGEGIDARFILRTYAL